MCLRVVPSHQRIFWLANQLKLSIFLSLIIFSRFYHLWFFGFSFFGGFLLFETAGFRLRLWWNYRQSTFSQGALTRERLCSSKIEIAHFLLSPQMPQIFGVLGALFSLWKLAPRVAWELDLVLLAFSLAGVNCQKSLFSRLTSSKKEQAGEI